VPGSSFVDPRLSPLWQVADNPLLHQFVGYLVDARRGIEADEDAEHVLTFERSRLAEVEHAFRTMVRRGEERLHRLSRLIADRLYESPHELASSVVGESVATGERFTIGQPITPERLYGLTDLELGARLLERVRLDGSPARLVANRVEYLPTEENDLGVHKVLSRIKATEELWNKVVDEIFDVDALASRDKELRALSRYVKDVFGLKVVVGATTQVRPVHELLLSTSWTRAELAEHGVPPGDDTVRLELIETKDYLRSPKSTGWTALKSVVRWWDRVFEIQVQPLRSYYREKERMTRESHRAWGDQRERLRAELAERVPLFGFYADLLRWLFLGQQGAPPGHGRVRVELR